MVDNHTRQLVGHTPSCGGRRLAKWPKVKLQWKLDVLVDLVLCFARPSEPLQVYPQHLGARGDGREGGVGGSQREGSES